MVLFGHVVFYIILTTFFVFLIINEKRVGRWIKVRRDRFSEKLASYITISIHSKWMTGLKGVHLAYTVLFAMIIYNNVGLNRLMVMMILLNVVLSFLSYKRATICAGMFALNGVSIVATWLFGPNSIYLQTGGTGMVMLFFTGSALFYFLQIFTMAEAIKKCVDIVEAIITAVVLVLLIQHFYVGNFLVPTTSMVPTIQPQDRMFANMIEYKFFNPKRGQVIVFKEPMTNNVDYTKRIIGLPGESVHVGGDGKVYINGTALTGPLYNRTYLQMGALGAGNWVVPKKGDTIRVEGGDFTLSGKPMNAQTLNAIQYNLRNSPAVSAGMANYGTWILNGKEVTGPCLDLLWDKKTLAELEAGKTITLTHNYYFCLGDNSPDSLDSRYWGFVAQPRIKGSIFFKFFPIQDMGIVK